MIFYGITWFFLLLEHMSTFWFYTSMYLFSLYVLCTSLLYEHLMNVMVAPFEASRTSTWGMLSDHCRWVSVVATTSWSFIPYVMGSLVMQLSCTLWPRIPYTLIVFGYYEWYIVCRDHTRYTSTQEPFTARSYCWFWGFLSNVVAGGAFEVIRPYPCAPRYGCSPLSVSTLYLWNLFWTERSLLWVLLHERWI